MGYIVQEDEKDRKEECHELLEKVSNGKSYKNVLNIYIS